MENSWKERKERLKQETLELMEKTNKLNDYMRNKPFYHLPRRDKKLLYRQYHAMLDYLELLGERCEIYEIDLKVGEDNV